MAREKKNKLTVYLIKEEFQDYEQFLRDFDNLNQSDDIEGFFYGECENSEPSWLKYFFLDDFTNSDTNELRSRPFKIFNANPKAVYVVEVEGRIFVLTFGYGHTLLIPGTYEERFGLKIALNLIETKNIKCIDKKNLTKNPKISREQMTISASIDDFEIDIEQDLMLSLTGHASDESFGNIITGRDSLCATIPNNYQNIRMFLVECLQFYNMEIYKTNYPWIDYLEEIKNNILLDTLNNLLVDFVKNKNENVWLAIPEIIDWEDLREFKFGRHSLGDELYLEKLLDFLNAEELDRISIKFLKQREINYFSEAGSTPRKHWKIFNCLYAEINFEERNYILSNGKWYNIDEDFSNNTERNFQTILNNSKSITLPNCNIGEKEGEYNSRIGNEVNYLNMDKKLVSPDGAKSRIEFCDLLTLDKKIICVKKYGQSAVLSHLFAQGLVSARVFLTDETFRKRLNEILDVAFKLSNTAEIPNAREYTIVYAIITPQARFNIPFFSKVNLGYVKSQIEAFGYKCALIPINMN